MRSPILVLLIMLATVFAHAQSSEKQQKKLKKKILKETREGGSLDFFTPIKGHEYDGLQVKPQVYASKIEIAHYQWGQAVGELGVANLETAYAIFAEFKGRELNSRETQLIKMGFNREFEK